MQRLDGLIFEIHNFDNARVSKFNMLLQTLPQWTIPRFLAFRGPVNHTNFRCLARCFPSDILETVGLPSRPNKKILPHLRASHPSIKALCLWDISNAEIPGYIAEYFPRIESIVIDQDRIQPFGPRHDEERIVRSLLVWPEYWHS
jgi:hypothetical protein